MACPLRSPSAVFSISFNGRFLPKALWSVVETKNVQKCSAWVPQVPSTKYPKRVKGKSFYGVWYQICLKTKSNKTSTLSNSPWKAPQLPAAPAAPHVGQRPGEGMQLCRSLTPVHVGKHPHHAPTLHIDISKLVVLAQVFWHCRKTDLAITCLPISLYWTTSAELGSDFTASSVRMQSLAVRVQPRISTIPWYKMSGFCHQ